MSSIEYYFWVSQLYIKKKYLGNILAIISGKRTKLYFELRVSNTADLIVLGKIIIKTSLLKILNILDL